MHDMMKRHEVQVLRRADVTQEQVAKLTGISLRSVRTIEAEAPVVMPDDAAERQTRGIGRPSKTEPFRGLVVKLLAEDPDLLSLEVRRAGASPSTGGALQCHGAPDRRVDRSTADPGFPGGDSPPVPCAGQRDKICGEQFRRATEVLGIEQVVTAARSPWQNPYAERLIGSLRRDCLDHVIVLGEVYLRRIPGKYSQCYYTSRCHLSLAGDAPEHRAIQGSALKDSGRTLPRLGGGRGGFRNRRDYARFAISGRTGSRISCPAR